MAEPTPRPENVAATVERIAKELGESHEHPNHDGEPYLIIPAGSTYQSLGDETIRKTPYRKQGTTIMRDAASFIRLVQEQSEPNTRIYATMKPARFLAVINDHGPGASGQQFRDYRIDFTVPPSVEWTTWTEKDRRDMSQLAFAEFLEDNLPDITVPNGTDLMALVLAFEQTRNASFRSVQRLKDGSVDFAWVDEADKYGNSIKMPDKITLSIPVFENDGAVDIDARLKYRVKDGSLTLRYELVRPHKVLESEFREVWRRIGVALASTTILLGSPEFSDSVIARSR
jgi:uncharacterized protein YfdQ (DUF2303 family)